MPIGWLAALKLVPWVDVITAAPKVAEGAKKLWDTVGRQPVNTPPTPVPTGVVASAPELGRLAARLAEAETHIATLHAQLLDATGLLKTLSEQNTQLIARIETNRQRVRLLSVALVLVVAALAGLWIVR